MATKTTSAKAAMQLKVRELYKTVQEQKLAIASAESGSYLGDGKFSFSPQSGQPAIDIKVARTTDVLTEIASFLLSRNEKHEEAAKLLNLTTVKPFKWQGATLGQWVNDLKVRASQIELITRKEKLQSNEVKLDEMIKLVDPDFLVELKMEALAASIEG